MLSYPILARLYDPAEFGLLVVFTSIVSMIGVLSTASLESAVLIPTDEDEAAAVAWASLAFVVLTATVTAVGRLVRRSVHRRPRSVLPSWPGCGG